MIVMACIPDQGSNLDFSPCSGCTDNNAFNYDQGALIDDGSCLSVVNGCTDATAFNYNEEANTDDLVVYHLYMDVQTQLLFSSQQIQMRVM